MYGKSWRKDPAIILEPLKCDAHSSGQCDLQLLFPDGERDAGTSALWMLFSQVRICQTEQCSGLVVTEATGKDLDTIGGPLFASFA
jgi:hypothetical protein